jgi:hypothetical protein
VHEYRPTDGKQSKSIDLIIPCRLLCTLSPCPLLSPYSLAYRTLSLQRREKEKSARGVSSIQVNQTTTKHHSLRFTFTSSLSLLHLHQHSDCVDRPSLSLFQLSITLFTSNLEHDHLNLEPESITDYPFATIDFDYKQQ